MEHKAEFRYNYSAEQNKEIQEIRNRYLPREENKLEELRGLDRRVRRAGQAAAICVGIIGCLIFGVGMCFGLHVLGNSMTIGVILGILGVVVMLPAYPIYRSRQRNAKEIHQSRILELSAELSGEQNG